MTATTLTTEQKRAALRACAVFGGMPGDEVGVLAEMMTTESLRPGETLFEAGEPSDRVFVVVTGRLEVFVGQLGQPGRAEAVRTLGPGDLLGEYGMFLGNVRTATIRAAASGPALLLGLDYQRFRSFLLVAPEATLVLLETAVRRLVELERDRR